MTTLLRHATIAFSLVFSLNLSDAALPREKSKKTVNPDTTPKIQVAILLDVSNSMDGLIEQAKAQLWNMVSVMGKAKCDGVVPRIEIALYEYGRSSNDAKLGYVKQISGFTNDLDKLSQNLFQLNTNGGDEYCGHVIHTSLNELNWEASSSNYKVIFIAGNEDFLQGDVSYTVACTEAKKKGVIVNTIYCGDRMQGIREHWNLGSECGAGSFTNINQDAKIEDIPTPYDTTLLALNNKLNSTYISYGEEGEKKLEVQAAMDKQNYALSPTAGAKRTAVKSQSNLYSNTTWDLVDATKNDESFITKVNMKTLPDSLKNKSRNELQKIVAQKSKERSDIQKQIATVSMQRDGFITAEKVKNAGKNNTVTLETEVEKIIRQQAKRFNMSIQ